MPEVADLSGVLCEVVLFLTDYSVRLAAPAPVRLRTLKYGLHLPLPQPTPSPFYSHATSKFIFRYNAALKLQRGWRA